MRRYLAIALVATGIVGGSTTALANVKTQTHYKHHTIHYTFHFKARATDPRYAIREFARVNARMIRKARQKFDVHQRWLHTQSLLRAAEASIAAAQTAIAAPIGGVWGCLARHEEGGANTAAHGYFGFMSPPSAYGSSAGSWLELSWSQQVAIAETVDPVSGWPNTGPICGLW